MCLIANHEVFAEFIQVFKLGHAGWPGFLKLLSCGYVCVFFKSIPWAITN